MSSPRPKHRHYSRRGAALGGVLACAVSLTLASCAGSDAADEKTDASGRPIVQVLVAQNPDQMPVAEMGWTAQVEELCECAIEWESVDATGFGEQRAAMLAAQDVPDISISAFSVEDTQRNPYFEDLGTHLDQMPNLREYFDTVPTARQTVATTDDEVFSVSSYMGAGYEVPGRYMIVNKTWLEALDLEPPRTWDELHDMLVAFKEQDPNGNGKADEIPLNINQLSIDSFGGFASPFLLLNSAGLTTHFATGSMLQGIYVEDGEVRNALVSEEYREVIGFLHQLMSEGLIPEDALTADSSQYSARNQADGITPTVGMVFGWGASDLGTEFEDQYISIAPPKADESMADDEVVWDASADTYVFTSNIAMSSSATNKEAAYRVIDALFSEEISVQQFRGTMPSFVTDDGDGTYTVTDHFWEASNDREALEGGFAGWISPDITLANEINIARLQKMDANYQDVYQNIDWENDVIPPWARPSEEDTNTIANNATNVLNYAMQMTASWLQDGNVDEQWDEYVDQVNTLGGTQNVELWQQIYDEARQK
ncbi:carbohydrate ABC transporter substrate-binding protein (CUT1 family) [Promicromonospora sp. AC04]|uniref:extracellular solute-binding protein n=1 Tax=Promicromonospora sp. AC04 TaxID=2135723 RepID=UPI000D35EA06|nr:extracellular solute-binding protein [Promicromonospora sp. AC04]PUB27615.1 carbohydrate ABC transporter substrate-binding protein (CUT1 family) [Promicromonospora sp. AC04]